MIHLRVSTLDQFRRCVQTDFADHQALARMIQGEPDEPSWVMQAGSIWHRLLAGQSYFPLNAAMFEPADVERGQLVMGPGLSEVTGFRRFGDVLLEGTCDHIRGKVITDAKTKVQSAPDARDYEDSLQWRSYLSIHGADVFRYCLFDFSEKKGHCTLKGVVEFRFYRYPGMEEDVARWTRRFVDWARAKGLENHLAQRRISA